MKKPALGEELTIRYQGNMVKARCGDVKETPARGTGSANFTIVSLDSFKRGTEAELIRGRDEVKVQIERVTVMGHRKANIVSFHGLFDFNARATERDVVANH